MSDSKIVWSRVVGDRAAVVGSSKLGYHVVFASAANQKISWSCAISVLSNATRVATRWVENAPRYAAPAVSRADNMQNPSMQSRHNFARKGYNWPVIKRTVK